VDNIVVAPVPGSRRHPRPVLPLALLALALSACNHLPRHAHEQDVLAIGDEGIRADPSDPASLVDDDVKFFDAHSGQRLAAPRIANGGLVGPAGVLFPDGPHGGLLVVNQNQFQPISGEVRHYDAAGKRLPDYVPATANHAAWAPRGAVVVNNKDGSRTLFVADVGDIFVRGRLLAYTLEAGKVVNQDHPFQLDPHLRNPDGSEAEFHPQAAVLGPDGYLYVSATPPFRGLPALGCGGSILRFNPYKRAFVDVAVENPPLCKENANDLHRPEGLVFSPHGDLYVTSFRQRSFDPNDPSLPDPNDPPKLDDNDRILIIPREWLEHRGRGAETNGRRPVFDRIDLWRTDLHQSRAFAEGLLFGPGGMLYVPISNTGEVRRYDAGTKRYTTFIPPANKDGPVWPVYLSFGKTDPATLAYDEPDRRDE
jgi:sugar lactone lactonase YvrE